MKRVCGVALGAILAAAVFAGEAQAAAFGIEMGTPVSKLKVTEHTDGTDIYIIDVPLPNSEFEAYQVLATAGQGVCKITGIGRDHKGDRAGFGAKGAIDDLNETLQAKYGMAGDSFDFLHPGSIWDEPGEWAAAVSKQERTFAKFWTREKAAKLPTDLEAITLEAKASDPSTTYVNLTYEFANFDACTAKLVAADKAGL